MKPDAGLAAALAVLLAIAAPASAGSAAAGPVLDRVRGANSVACAAEERPGFAEAGEDDVIRGLAVDLCRAVAVAVLGPQGKVAFTLLDSTRDYDAVRDGRQDLVFLSAGTIAAEHLAERLMLGPVAYVEPVALMVPQVSAAKGPRDLSGKSVCFMIGTGAQRAMEAAFERDAVPFMRLGFEEDVEMRDAYNVGRCQAVAGEATFLAEVRLDGGVHALRSRILDEPLAVDPVYLATGIDDARWSAIAGWTLQGLMLGAAPRSGWSGTGAAPLAAAVTPLGFRQGWYGEVEKEVGSYTDLWRRNLGDGSPLKLAPGPNAPWPAGSFLPPASP